MPPRLSTRARSVQPSATLATAARARELKAAGVPVISFSTGEPDFGTPEHIKEAAIGALREGATGYPPLGGIPQLKAAIAARIERDKGFSYAPDQILVSVGAKQSLYNLCQAVLDPGDRAIIPAPFWVSYPDMVVLAGAEPIVVPGRPEAGLVPRADDLARACDDRCRLLFLNSPSNPSGAVYPEEALREIAAFVREQPDLVVVSDDIYDRIVFDRDRAPHLLEVAPDLADRTVLVNGPSKAYAMTGWRLGWALGPRPIIQGMQRIQGQSTSGATHFAQYGAVAALEGDQEVVRGMVAEFKRRRDHMVDRLNAIPGMRCDRPGGAFYAFPDVRSLLGRKHRGHVLENDRVLCERLLEEKAVAVVFGSAFGGEGFLRLSYACGMDTIDAGLDRIAEFVAEIE